MNIPGTTRTATFTAEGAQDVVVRVSLFESQVGFSIQQGSAPPTVHNLPFEGVPKLQLTESLQFVADALGATVPGRMSSFKRGWTNVAYGVYDNAKDKGFWDRERNDAEMLCLIHSEISEALEGLRKGNPPDDKLPQFSSAEVELADAVIRIMDLGIGRGWDVAGAIEAKAAYNTNRPHMHGKKF